MKSRTVRLTTAKVERQGNEWFITGLPCGTCGPYSDEETAMDDALGLERTYKYHDKPGFVTCDPSHE